MPNNIIVVDATTHIIVVLTLFVFPRYAVVAVA